MRSRSVWMMGWAPKRPQNVVRWDGMEGAGFVPSMIVIAIIAYVCLTMTGCVTRGEARRYGEATQSLGRLEGISQCAGTFSPRLDKCEADLSDCREQCR